MVLRLAMLGLLSVSCTPTREFNYEGIDYLERKINIQYQDSEGKFIDEPYKVGDTVYCWLDGQIIDNFEGTDRQMVVITAIR